MAKSEYRPSLSGRLNSRYELRVLVRVRLGELGELAEDLLDARLPDARHDAVLLEYLAAHVERQVLRVDDAAHEAKVDGQELLLVVGYEDALDVELDAGAIIGAVEVERRLRGNIEEGGVLDRALGLGVNPMEGRRVVAFGAEAPEARAREGLIELDVVLVLELGLGPAP